jgi:hypothetical protein
VFVDEGPDVTPPEARADLDRVLRLGRNAGVYVVVAECTDDRGDVTTAADINGVPVEDGDIAFLFEHHRRRSIVTGNGVVFTWAPRFTLTVTCTDAAGNTTTASSSGVRPGMTS